MNVRLNAVYRAMALFAVLLVSFTIFAFHLISLDKQERQANQRNEIELLINSNLASHLKDNGINNLELISEQFTNNNIDFLHLYYNGQNFHLGNKKTEQGIITKEISILDNGNKIGSALIGFKYNTEKKFIYSLEALLLFALTTLSLLAILSIYFMLKFAARPLRKLADLIEQTEKSHEVYITPEKDEIEKAIYLINSLKQKLVICEQYLQFALESKKYIYQNARQLEEKNLAIYHASLDAIVVTNEKNIIIEFSQIAERLFHWKREDIIGRSIIETIVPSHFRTIHINDFKSPNRMKKKRSLNKRIELIARRNGGEEFPIEIFISSHQTSQGKIFVSYIRDITKNINDQTKLKLTAQAFENSEAMFIADNKGHIIRINSGFTKVTGFNQQDIKALKPRKIMANCDDETFHKHIWNELNERNIWSSELILRHKLGHEFPAHMNITAVKDQHNYLTHYVAHFVDMTDQKRTQQMLSEAQYAAELANKSKNRFFAAMSHEIRTPINGVIGVLGLLKETSLNEKQYGLVKAARSCSEDLLVIINDILDFSKMEAGKLTLEKNPFDLHSLLKQVSNIMRPQANKKQLAFNENLPDNLPRYFVGDGDRIRQVIISLLSNAIKYTSKGQIEITLKHLKNNDNISTIQIDISDTGVGISLDNVEQLFDKFTMVENSYARSHGGCGLGLAICKQLINLMGGTLRFKSEVNKGSTFTIELALPQAKKEDVAQNYFQSDNRKLEHNISKELRILMAEDNPVNQIILRSILEYSGLSVDIVSNGQEAIDAVKALPYDIVLMDISMPEVDGVEATKQIRSLDTPQKNVPIVALTAHTIRGDKEYFLASGMDDFIAKPITKQSILNCLARWQPKIKSATQEKIETIPNQQNSHLEISNELVDEFVLSQLASDTSAEIVPDLIEHYLIDSKNRVANIKKATDINDYESLCFEAHTLGSAAGTYGNSKLFQLCRLVENHCKKQEYEQAITLSSELQKYAHASFIALQKRAALGFIPK